MKKMTAKTKDMQKKIRSARKQVDLETESADEQIDSGAYVDDKDVHPLSLGRQMAIEDIAKGIDETGSKMTDNDWLVLTVFLCQQEPRQVFKLKREAPVKVLEKAFMFMDKQNTDDYEHLTTEAMKSLKMAGLIDEIESQNSDGSKASPVEPTKNLQS
jgi:hypothetical protein